MNFRFATIREVEIYYRWTSDPVVRQNSFHSGSISYEQHVAWFTKKLLDPNCYLYFFELGGLPAGQVRIELGEENVIGISVDQQFRGKSLASQMLSTATGDFLDKHQGLIIIAYIKKDNVSSYKAFQRAGFVLEESLSVSGVESYKMKKSS